MNLFEVFQFFKTSFSKCKKQRAFRGSFFLRIFNMSFYKDNRQLQKKFYDTKKWKRLRKSYLFTHPTCERCEAAGLISVAEHVHHKIELTEENVNDPNITLNPDNLEALCFDCHRKEHHDLPEVADELFFDENGNLRKKSEASRGGIEPQI